MSVTLFFKTPFGPIGVLLSAIVATWYSSVSSQRFRLDFAGRAIRAIFFFCLLPGHATILWLAALA